MPVYKCLLQICFEILKILLISQFNNIIIFVFLLPIETSAWTSKKGTAGVSPLSLGLEKGISAPFPSPTAHIQ